MKISKIQEKRIRSNFAKMYGKGYTLEDIAAECEMTRESFTRKAVQLGLYKQPKKSSDFTQEQISRMRDLYREGFSDYGFPGIAKIVSEEFKRKVSESGVRGQMIKLGVHRARELSKREQGNFEIRIADFCQEWLCRLWI